MSTRRLRVELAPSCVLASTLIALHAAAGVCVVTVMPGRAGVALGALLIALGIATAWSRALLRSGSSLRTLELAGPVVTLGLANGTSFSAEAAERRYVGRLMVIVPLKTGPGHRLRRTIVVTRDMVGADSFRRLRIWALWGKLPVAPKQLPA